MACGLLENGYFETYSRAGYGHFDAVSGHIVELNNHGAISYITLAQDRVLSLLTIGAFSFFLIAVLLDLFERGVLGRTLHFVRPR